ncbi:hypothetical protein EPN44_12470 [bacterium]|nr:MAG: hypothetical protein EPN44_12470 [bacterium]
MLAQVLVPLFALALLVASLAAGTTAAARAAVQRAAMTVAAGELEHAQQRLIDAVAGAVRSGGALAAPPPSVALVAYAGNTWRVETSVALTGASATASGTATASAMQTAPAIQEGRIAARVSAVVRGGDGTPLATRTHLVTLRTLAVAPYAVVSGLLEGDGIPIEEQGDSGGAVTGDDTRIHAVMLCADGGSGACNGATPRPVDRYRDQTWEPGTEAEPGWRR